MIARINFLVHNETVQIRILRNQPQISGNDDAHVRDAYTAAAALPYVILNRLKVDIYLNRVGSIIPLGHDVRDDFIHRVIALDTISITSIHILCSPIMYS